MPGALMGRVRGLVLADDDVGDLSLLTSLEQPKALLPVANRPLLYYALLSLHRAGVESVTIVASESHAEPLQAYVDILKADEFKNLNISLLRCRDSDGTADAVKALEGEGEGDGAHTLVINAGLVTDCAFGPAIEQHFASGSSCTALFAERRPPAGPLAIASGEKKAEKGAKGGGKGGGGKKKEKSGGSKVNEFEPEVFVTTCRASSRLLEVLDAEELDGNGIVHVRPPLLRRFTNLSVRSDLSDLNVYIFAPWVLKQLLPARPQIASIAYDLVPYLARRQFTLSRKSEAKGEDWGNAAPLPSAGEVIVSLHVESYGHFVRRIATCESYLGATLEVAAGALVQYLGGDPGSRKGGEKAISSGKDKKKSGGKPAKAESPFASAGDKTNVSSDSLVGSNCTAGDRTSVKKSCVASNVSFGANVKLNGCAVLNDVKVGDGVSLNSCVLSAGASVEEGCVLKHCRVAAGVTVPAGTEADDVDYGVVLEHEDAFGLGFEISFDLETPTKTG